MTDAGFVLSAYGVILGGLAAYALTLARRVAAVRREAERAGRPPDEAE